MRTIGLFTALLGVAGVALGAFGAHALRDQLLSTGRTAVWETAVQYHLFHVVALWATVVPGGQVASAGPARWRWKGPALCWLLGIAAFSGSLYILALGGPRWLGPITPFGGLALITGWAWAGLILWRQPARL